MEDLLSGWQLMWLELQGGFCCFRTPKSFRFWINWRVSSLYLVVLNLLKRTLLGVLRAVYGPNDTASREEFWLELGSVRGLWGDPWCIGGDFNITRFPNERNRVGLLPSSMRRFSDVIEELEQKGPSMQGIGLLG